MDWLPTEFPQYQHSAADGYGHYLFPYFALALHKEALRNPAGGPVLTAAWSVPRSDPLDIEQKLHDFALAQGLHPFGVYGEHLEQTPSVALEAPDSWYDRNALYQCEGTLLSVDGCHGRCRLATRDKTLLKTLSDWIPTIQTTSASTVSFLVSSALGFETQQLELPNKSPLCRENYTPEVLTGFDLIAEALVEPKPFGRLAILDGPQGTGKSFMVRALVEVVSPDKALFLFVPANLVSQLSGPNFVTVLFRLRGSTTKGKSLILVVEDADQALVTRDGTNEAGVSTLLNLTDGILGDLLDVRMICTTNRKLEEIDKAVRRKGRLICHAHLGPLPVEQARAVYERLAKQQAPKGVIDRPMPLADVYALTHQDDHQASPVRESLGFKLGRDERGKR